jgi:hypothetical protein
VQAVIDFFGSAAGVEILRIIDSVGTIIAAILSGAALNNAIKVKKAIGGTIEQGLKDAIKGWFAALLPKRRRRASMSATLEQPPPMTIDQKIEGLKETYEKNWTGTGMRLTDLERRMDRIAPRRHKNE